VVLIIESGSTKADWVLLKGDAVHHSFETEGLNPFSNKASYKIITQTAEKLIEDHDIREVHFYGAGIVGNEVPDKVRNSFYPLSTAKINVDDDLLAAARATCKDQPGVVCILGTGSNIGFYDGEKVVEKVASGGYLLGGEGSGMALGKQVLIKYLRNQFSDKTMQLFASEYNITTSDVTDKLYSQEIPNRYMASFAPFVHRLTTSERDEITNKVFKEFLEYRILKLDTSRKFPIHMVGSIALSFRKEIEHMLKINNLAVGKVVDKPIHNLVRYHTETN